MKLAIINKDLCKPKKCNHECMKICPVNRTGSKCIDIEEIALISNELCIGCSQCEKRCPFHAIKVVQIPHTLEKNIVHSYGDNSFRLYNFLTPKQGVINGIIGNNGIGKSTLLKIISGNLLPNFGSADKVDKNLVLNKLKKKPEIKKYLTTLYQGNLKISYKDQNIGQLKNKLDGTVQEILSKYCFHNEFDYLMDKMDMKSIYETHVSKLSGGELQRLACLLTYLDEADIYIFDEVTNFLDIKQRLIIANLILNLKKFNKYVFIVDHDLSIFDYVCDYISIIHGSRAAFGNISMPYGISNAINMFFEGYVKQENMMIREHAIEYRYNLLSELKIDGIKSIPIIKYNNDVVKFDNFQLDVNGGVIESITNIVLLLGENGTGKTTFLNHLYKEIDIAISYKQQTINAKEWILNKKIPTVEQLLHAKINSSMADPSFVSTVLNALDYEDIKNKQINYLSGGEKQRVAIFLSLGEKADVYFLDEPSAMLDIEYRICLPNIIKRFMFNNHKLCFVVEHDMMISMSLGLESDSKVIIFDKDGRISKTSEPMDSYSGMNKFMEKMNIT